MRTFARIVFILLLPAVASADTLRGVVIGPDRQPLAEATVTIEHLRSIRAGSAGHFAFEVPPGEYTLRVSAPGFQSREIAARSGDEVTVELKPAMEQTIVVSGIRAGAETPVTKSDITRDQIEREYYGQDIPALLRDTPSVNTYAEGGIGGAGYSYLTLRGISPTRINFTLDGVPLADSEDMATYFVDLPDLAHSLQSIQVQRGAGTSTVGAAAFGGSVNLESVALAPDAGTDVWLGGGSFGTKLGSVGVQSGALPYGLALYGRLSVQETDGFRAHSGVRQHNFFFSAAKQNDRSQWRLTGFTGHEKQQNSYFAADAATLETDLRANPMSPQEGDSFGYNLAQLQYLRALSSRSNLSASVFFQRGYGWYRLFDDAANGIGLRQYGLDGLLAGAMITLGVQHGRAGANYGLHVNRFRREHTRDLVGGPRDYFNDGTKGEINAFAKYTWDSGRWHLYSDNQLRSTDFHYHGDVSIAPIRWTFFNPKLGARYATTARSSVYASAGLSRREPARNDLFQGEDNPTVPHDLHAVRPERLLDLEAGWDLHTARATIAANIYAMEFHDEIAATGELSDIGLPLRRNVDRSDRRGIELSASWQPIPSLRLDGNANLSTNRIHHWTQFFDVYDAEWNWTGSRAVNYFDVRPLLTPSVLINQRVEYTPTPRMTLGAVGRYTSRSYLDNTNNGAFVTPSIFVVDASATFAVWHSARLMLQVNNVFDNRRVFPSGYSYEFFTPEGLDGTSYFYPQATRNAVLTLRVGL